MILQVNRRQRSSGNKTAVILHIRSAPGLILLRAKVRKFLILRDDFLIRACEPSKLSE